jgi:hypothetical protein
MRDVIPSSGNGICRCVLTIQVSEHETKMPESYALATEPEGVVASLLERFNSGKVSAMLAHLEPAAVSKGSASDVVRRGAARTDSGGT